MWEVGKLAAERGFRIERELLGAADRRRLASLLPPEALAAFGLGGGEPDDSLEAQDARMAALASVRPSRVCQTLEGSVGRAFCRYPDFKFRRIVEKKEK